MMKIEVIGAEFNNKGAELMLVAICQQLQKALNLTPLMAPSLYASYEQRISLGMKQVLRLQFGRFDLSPLLTYLPYAIETRLLHFGIVIEPRINVVLDASGYAYGDNWSLQRLKATAAIAKRIKKQGGKYILLPQALGPFENPNYVQAAKALFSHCDVVFARDEKSLSYIKAIAPQSNFLLAPDFTALAKPSRAQLLTDKSTSPTEKVLCVIPNQNMQKVMPRDAYLAFLVQVSVFFDRKGFQCQILNHEGQADRVLCELLQKQLSEQHNIRCSIVAPATALDVKAVIQQASWLVSSRFHGCVSGLSSGKPTLGTSWSHKYEALYQDYGLPQYLVDVNLKETELVELLNRLYNEREQDEVIQQENISRITDEIHQMWETVIQRIQA